MKHRLNYVEVYITNTCNLSCSHCQSLNNFAFKGHQLWIDYQHKYTELSAKIEFDRIQIMGGEPTLNPDFSKWVQGISDLWPNSKIEIATNGARLDKLDSTIYNILQQHQGCLWFTCHDIDYYNQLLTFGTEFLKDIVSDDLSGHEHWHSIYQSVKQAEWPDCKSIDEFHHLPEEVKQEFNNKHRLNQKLDLGTTSRVLRDSNGVEVKLDWAQTFVSSAVQVRQNTLEFKYNNDPVEAHDKCYFKSCHQLNKGKLYKCPLVSVLPDFVAQFDLNLSDYDRKLALAYKPVDNRTDNNEIASFIANIDQPISQCKFCPVNDHKYNFVGTDKKIKILARPEGFEPPTAGFEDQNSSTELRTDGALDKN